MKSLKMLWGTIGIIFSLGIVLAFSAEWIRTGFSIDSLSKFVEHLGIALIISAVVGICLEITEFKDLLEHRIIGILFGDDFIKLAATNHLVDMNIKAMNALGTKRVTNSDYNYRDFVKAIGGGVLDTIGNLYRKGYSEVIELKVLRPDEVKELGVDPDKLRTDVDIVYIKSTISFLFVVPNKEGEQSFPLKGTYKCSAPSELLDKFKFDIFVNDAKLTGFDVNKHLTKDSDSLLFDYSHTIMSYEHFTNDSQEDIEVSFEPKIEYIMESYQYDPRSLNRYLDILTNQIDVIFSSREEVMPKAEFFGFSGNTTKGTDNLASINNSDWGLPDAGYFISWQRKKSNQP